VPLAATQIKSALGSSSIRVWVWMVAANIAL